MKRKHSQNSSQKGCQIISKFFKTSERQDVHDAARLKEATDQVSSPKRSLVEPVLQKLTKLREALIKGGGFFRNVCTGDEEEIMSNNNLINENHCTSDNASRDCDARVVAECTSLSTENHSQEIVTSDEETSTVDDTKNIDSRNEHNSSNIDLYTDDDMVDTGGHQAYDTIENEGQGKCNNSMEHSVKETEDSQLMDDSEETIMDNNTEGNLGDDEAESTHGVLMTDDIKQELLQVSDKLSKVLDDSQETYDSQNSQESIEINDSDSDDDLLTPPSFLYESRVKSAKLLCTPEKITTPVGASPLCSPVKPARDMKKESEDKKYKFSLEQMLKESRRKEAKNMKLSKMEADLDAGIMKGGVKAMTSIISEDDTDTDDGKDLSQCKLPKEVSKHLVKVTNFSEELVGEDIFPGLCNCILDKELPHQNFPSSIQDDKFVQYLISSKACGIKEVICGGWFMQYYLKRPCPAPLAEWVFRIMYCYQDTYLSGHCFKTLWALLRAGYQDHNGIPKGIRGITWIPSISSIVDVLRYYGATIQTLIPNALTSTGLLPHIDIPIKEDKTFHTSNPPCSPQLVFVIRQLVQLLTHALHYANYMENDLPLLLVIICRLSLDVRLQELFFDLEVCIFEILNCFGRAQWDDQIQSLPSLLVHTSNNHRNLLHIMQVIPPSPRGSRLRRLTCVVLLKFFVKELSSEHVISDTKLRTDALQSLCKTTTFKLSELPLIVDEIKPKKTSPYDYYLLHTVIFLIDLAIGNEDYPPSQRAELKTLSNKLNSLNSDIKDPRAKFLDRTKVKDLLVRTVHKIHCLVDSIKPCKEKQLTEYFEVNSSDYVIQPLVGSTAVSDYKDENISSPENDNASSPGGVRASSPAALSNADSSSPGGVRASSPAALSNVDDNASSPGGVRASSPAALSNADSSSPGGVRASSPAALSNVDDNASSPGGVRASSPAALSNVDDASDNEETIDETY